MGNPSWNVPALHNNNIHNLIMNNPIIYVPTAYKYSIDLTMQNNLLDASVYTGHNKDK
jgi:hypothetical protein